MDHMLQVRVDHQSSPTLCDPATARFRFRFRRSADASQVALAFAAIASLALFLSSFSMATSPSSTLSARLVAAASIFMSKTALFVLSNAIFILLAADCRCCFTTAASASDAEPDGVMEKQTHNHQVAVVVAVEQCAAQSCVPCSESLDHSKQEGKGMSTMYADTSPDQELEDVSALSKLDLVNLEEDKYSITLDLETVDVKEPICETAKEMDRLEIDELNKKFDEFIRSTRTEWIKEEEAYLLL